MHRDTAPAERWQHGADPAAGDTGSQSVGRPLAALHKSGKIGDAEIVAADRFYRDYALGAMGSPDDELSGTGGGTPDGMAVATIMALGRYREACQAVGRPGTALLHALIIDSMTMTAIGHRTNLNAHVVSGMALLVLRQLTDHYHTVDSARSRRVSRRDTENG